jgi:hypothetical protein
MIRRVRRTTEQATPLLGLVLIVGLWAGVVGLYRAVSIMEYNALWAHEPRGLMSYTRPADTRYVEAFRKVQASAVRRGWFVPEHDIRQTTRLFDVWYVRWLRSPHVSINARRAQIIVDEQWMHLMSDDEVECVMAHEVGHSVDYRYGREQDMDLWSYRCEPPQRFADAVGAMLCGRVRYWKFFRRNIGYRPPEEPFCDDTGNPVTR